MKLNLNCSLAELEGQWVVWRRCMTHPLDRNVQGMTWIMTNEPCAWKHVNLLNCHFIPQYVYSAFNGWVVSLWSANHESTLGHKDWRMSVQQANMLYAQAPFKSLAHNGFSVPLLYWLPVANMSHQESMFLYFPKKLQAFNISPFTLVSVKKTPKLHWKWD